MKRHENWHKHYESFLLERKDQPFSWGSNDCALFAADAILANTGTDIASEFRGKYTTQLGAMKLIASITGGTTVADAAAHCATKHNLTEHTYPLMAKRGDLVVVDNGGTLIAGVIHLNGIHALSVSEDGLVRLPVLNAVTGKSAIIRAWSV